MEGKRGAAKRTQAAAAAVAVSGGGLRWTRSAREESARGARKIILYEKFPLRDDAALYTASLLSIDCTRRCVFILDLCIKI